MGAVSRVPVELTFIQLSSGHFHSCGITLDEKLVCWGGPNPKRFEPPGLYQQVSCGAVHTCGLRKDGQVKCWSFCRRPFYFYASIVRRRRGDGVLRCPSPRRGDGVPVGEHYSRRVASLDARAWTPSARDTIRHRRDSVHRAGARTTTRAARSRRPENSCRYRRATPSPAACGRRGWSSAGATTGRARPRRPTTSSSYKSRRRTSSTTRAG